MAPWWSSTIGLQCWPSARIEPWLCLVRCTWLLLAFKHRVSGIYIDQGDTIFHVRSQGNEETTSSLLFLWLWSSSTSPPKACDPRQLHAYRGVHGSMKKTTFCGALSLSSFIVAVKSPLCPFHGSSHSDSSAQINFVDIPMIHQLLPRRIFYTKGICSHLIDLIAKFNS